MATSKKVAKKEFRPMVLTRHPTHNPLRKRLPMMPYRSVVRLGSTTPIEDGRIEINTVEAIRNSSDKLRMKTCFMNGNVKTADWMSLKGNTTNEQIDDFTDGIFPVVLKHRFGSRGKGNTLCKSREELFRALEGKERGNYIIEKFYNYVREYRLHVTAEGCFYTCRKMLREGTPEHQKWYRNDSNCVWIMESNPSFDRPSCWDEMVEHSVLALQSCGLDFGACDVKVQSAKTDSGKNRKDVDFFIIEINSAPSFGDVTLERYLEQIPNIITRKANGNNI